VRLMLATGNRHKLREFQNILAPHEVVAMPAWVELPPEGEDSFVDNARGKAVGLARAAAAHVEAAGATAGPAAVDHGAGHGDPPEPDDPLVAVDFFMADDSGLEVEALEWAPGVTSARYAGEDASDEDNYVKLLSQLEGKSLHERRARFVCVVVAVSPEGRELVARGEWWGTITFSPHGGGGFGYDPVFLPEGSDLTVAQMPQARKDQASHRALAGSALLESFEREGLHAPGSDPAR
jgi:XTP/dITP diphosphohydrolase